MANHLVRPRPRSRQPNRLRHRVKIGQISLAHGLLDQLIAAVGNESEARLKLGQALHHHQNGCFGSVTRSDAALNAYVLREAALRGTRHCVVSRHAAGKLSISITTFLGGSTSVRLADRQPVQDRLRGAK